MPRAPRSPLASLITILLLACRPTPAEPTGHPEPAPIPSRDAIATTAPPEACTLVRWEDGDTPYVRCADGREDPVRLLGVDTPESGFDENSIRRARWQSELWHVTFDEVLACGKAATAAAKEICPEGSAIEVVGVARDRYQRRLAYVVCAGLEVNGELVARGAAGRYPFPGDPERPAGCPIAQEPRDRN